MTNGPTVFGRIRYRPGDFASRRLVGLISNAARLTAQRASASNTALKCLGAVSNWTQNVPGPDRIDGAESEVSSRHCSQRPPASDLRVNYEGGATHLTWNQMLKVARLKLPGYKAPPPSVSNNKVPDRPAGSDQLVIAKAAQDSGCRTLLDKRQRCDGDGLRAGWKHNKCG
jgi:hypothetical protein